MSDENIEVPSDVSLEVLNGDEKGEIFNITNKSVTMGRKEECDVQLSDKHISNKHCQIVYRGGHFTVIDLGSLNKTNVNGKMYVQKNLKNNDIIMIGKTQIRFRFENQDEVIPEQANDTPLEEL